MKGVREFIPFSTVERVVVVQEGKYLIVFAENDRRITRAVYPEEVEDHGRFQSILKKKVKLEFRDEDIEDQEYVGR